VSADVKLKFVAEADDDDFGGDISDVYPDRPAYLPLGTISRGTCNTKHILEAYLEVLATVDPARAVDLKELMAETPEHELDEFLWETVTWAMEKHAPPYTYVGPHPGDGSDYGVWVSTETLDDDSFSDSSDRLAVVYRGEPIPKGSDYVAIKNDQDYYVALLDGRTGEELWNDEPGVYIQPGDEPAEPDEPEEFERPEDAGFPPDPPDAVQEGTGIFVKQLDNGRKIYSSKCPVCSAITGGYRTYAEAERKLKCPEHRRSEIEKLKKEVEKVDEPKKPKDIFTQSPNKPAVLGESDEEPRIRGEYWVTDSGTWFADGDVGDVNHEGYAMDMARRKILDLFGQESQHEFCDEDEFEELVIEGLEEEGVIFEPEDWLQATERYIVEHTEEKDREQALAELEAASGRGDARYTAVKYWGWIWVRGNHFSIWKYDRHELLSAVNDVISEEDTGVESLDWSDFEITVGEESTQKHFSITVGELESGRTPSKDPTWPGSQLEALDDDFEGDFEIGDLVGPGPVVFDLVMLSDNMRFRVNRNGIITGSWRYKWRHNLRSGTSRRGQLIGFRSIISTMPFAPADVISWAEIKQRLMADKGVVGNPIVLRHNGKDQVEWDKAIITPWHWLPKQQESVDAEVTKTICESAFFGQRLWYRDKRHVDGGPVSVQVVGPCLTWEDKPNGFSLLVKLGNLQTVYITENNAAEFTLVQPAG
jgi:hypothetical protein